MALPVLPGYSFSSNVGKEKFHKSQHWGFYNNIRMLLGEDKPGIGGEPLRGQKVKPRFSTYLKDEGFNTPPWEAFDKKVLSFDAYMGEETHDKREEKYRIRYYKIYFYPEDDTVQVNEPQKKNSRLPQGPFIQRHRIPLPPPDDDRFYTAYHFNINVDITFYVWTFKIYECDMFTKNFLTKIGVKVNPPGTCPEDPYLKMREEFETVYPRRPYESLDTGKQFLEYNGKVLRFFGEWDDSASFGGEWRKCVLLYFLADDTIAVKEKLPQNSGRDESPFVLKKGKLPKDGPSRVYQPGQITNHGVLNLYGGYSVLRKYDFLLDRHKLGEVKQSFYKDSDLSVGTTVNVWGRKMRLYDCDEFTRTYYKAKYGIENIALAEYKPPPPTKIERKFPPYTGFGSEEDSLRSCLSLWPTPPPTNFKNVLNEISYGLRCKALRYFAKIMKDKLVNAHRMFVISYFLIDGTLSVFEPRDEDSGYTGGLFLKRGRVKRPGQKFFKSEFSEYIQPEELYVGTKININGYIFLLVNADEYTLNYMEKNLDKYPYSNLKTALQKLKDEKEKLLEIKSKFADVDFTFTKMVDFPTFRKIMLEITAGKLIDQEIITIARHYRAVEDDKPDVVCLVARAHDMLRRKLYVDFKTLIFSCGVEDREQKKVLPKKDVKTLCKTHRFPLADDVLAKLLSRFEDSEGKVKYESLFNALDWTENPLPALVAPEYLKKRCEEVWIGMPSPVPAKYIRYFDLLREMFGEDEV
ncbi:EF-hand domain-containing family member C2 [Ctenodactylus gundi]